MVRLSQCLQKHYLKNKVPVSIFAIFTMVGFLLSMIAQAFSHTYQSFIPIPETFFFPTDLTNGHAPRFEKVSLETKYNIVVGTQTALKPTLLDGLHKLTPEQEDELRVFCCRRTLKTFSCDFFMCASE